MIRLLQTDQRWANEYIDHTNLTIGRWGCTITSIAMALNYFKKDATPLKLASTLSFTNDGYLIWSSLKQYEITPIRIRSADYRRIDIALANPNEVALLEMRLGRGSHWAVALRKIPFSNHYVIADPLKSGFVTTMKYGGVIGCCILSNP